MSYLIQIFSTLKVCETADDQNEGISSVGTYDRRKQHMAFSAFAYIAAASDVTEAHFAASVIGQTSFIAALSFQMFSLTDTAAPVF